MNEVLTRDLSSGRIHRRIAVPGGYATLEGDNLDEAGEFEVITTLDNAEKGDPLRAVLPTYR